VIHFSEMDFSSARFWSNFRCFFSSADTWARWFSNAMFVSSS